MKAVVQRVRRAEVRVDGEVAALGYVAHVLRQQADGLRRFCADVECSGNADQRALKFRLVRHDL